MKNENGSKRKSRYESEAMVIPGTNSISLKKFMQNNKESMEYIENLFVLAQKKLEEDESVKTTQDGKL